MLIIHTQVGIVNSVKFKILRYLKELAGHLKTLARGGAEGSRKKEGVNIHTLKNSPKFLTKPVLKNPYLAKLILLEIKF